MESDENQQDPTCMESSVFKSNIPFVHTYMYVIEPWFGDFLLSIYYLVVCNYKNRFSKTLLRNSLESVWCSKVDFVLLFVSQQTECKTTHRTVFRPLWLVSGWLWMSLKKIGGEQSPWDRGDRDERSNVMWAMAYDKFIVRVDSVKCCSSNEHNNISNNALGFSSSILGS